MIICFTGIDGSGKTVQARALVERLNAEGHPAVYAWTGGRSYITRPLIWLAKRMLRAPRLAKGAVQHKKAGDAVNRSSEQYRSYLSSTSRLFSNGFIRTLWNHISLIEHTAEVLVATVPHVLRGRIVVCDRYIYDSLIGTAVLARLDPKELPALLKLGSLYPVLRPAMWFLIDVPASVAFSRRDDVVDVAFLEQRIPFYLAAAQALTMCVVDGTESPSEVATNVWNNIQPLFDDAASTIPQNQ